ncbi:FKBP-type peptidyl-prolyl cis-trans isomerase [Providencia sp. wls1943]|uniref:FKBP-type peptidyl-prolyl cis-trans isomerase n=1 Tax=Providencia sp. wls1943 TaxID=2675150 RepID=UPI001E36E1EF
MALFSTCFSTASYAERFNNVIDDFDTYLQSENEGQKPRPRPVEVPLSVKSQAQGYDVLSSLSPVPVPKENRQVTTGKAKSTKEKKVAQRSSNTVTSSQSQSTKASVSTPVEPKTPVQVTEPAQVVGTEIKPAIDVCSLPSESQSYQPASSYLLQGNQWNPKYLAKDFAKYQVIIDPLGLYSSNFTKKAGTDNSVNLAQLAKLIEQQQLKNLYRFGVAQGVGELISYNRLLTDGQLVTKLTNYNKDIAELNRIITEKQTTIAKLSDDIAASKLQIEQLQNVVKSVDNKAVIDGLNNELTKSQKVIAEKQANLDNLTKQNNQSLDTIKQLEKQLGDGVIEATNAKKQLADKDKQVTDAHQRIEQLTTEIAKLQSDAKQQLQSSGNTDEQLKSVNANLVKQEALLKQREDELKLAQAQKSDVQSALKQQQDAVKQLEQQNQQLTDKVKQKSAVEAELATSKQQLAKANIDLQNVKQELESKAVLMAQASDKQVKALSEQNQKLLTQLAEKSQQNDKAQATLVEQTAKLVQKNALDVELAEAKKQQATQQNAHEKIAKQLADSQNQYTQLQAQLASNEQSYADAKKQLAQANTEVQKLRAELEKQTELAGKDTDLQVKELTAELHKQISLLKGREEALTKLDLENKSIQDSLKAQLSDKQQLESQNVQLMSQTKEKEALIAKLESDLANRNKQQAEIEQKLLDANKQLNALKLDAEKFNAENLSKKDQELLQLKKQLDEKTAADNKSKLELASVQDSLKKAKDELASLKAFSTDEGLKTQIRDLNQRVTQLREENDALRASKKTPTGKTPTIIQIPSADNATIAKENEKRNQKILQDIKQQKYSKLDNYTYYKVLQKGTPITNVKDKKITLIMREQLTDGKVTVMHTEKNPMVLPYDQLPPPMNSFVEKVGVGGMVKIYIEPEGGYGPEGIPGEVPPNSMSIIDLKVIQAN